MVTAVRQINAIVNQRLTRDINSLIVTWIADNLRWVHLLVLLWHAINHHLLLHLLVLLLMLSPVDLKVLLLAFKLGL